METPNPAPDTVNPRVFATTHWSLVVAAGDKGSPQAAAALAELCRSYWYPLYAYVRRKGYPLHDAQDLTQEFFARLLERNDFRMADRRRGRFRSFLLGALEHFLAKEWRRARSQKRGGGRKPVSWEAGDAEGRYEMEAPGDWTAERVFERRWALTVLERAMAALRAEYEAGDRLDQFDNLKLFISGDAAAVVYPELASRLKMTEGALRVAVHRLRQRYGDCVRAEIARVVHRPEEIEDEVRQLFVALD